MASPRWKETYGYAFVFLPVPPGSRWHVTPKPGYELNCVPLHPYCISKIAMVVVLQRYFRCNYKGVCVWENNHKPEVSLTDRPFSCISMPTHSSMELVIWHSAKCRKPLSGTELDGAGWKKSNYSIMSWNKSGDALNMRYQSERHRGWFVFL